MHHTGDGSRIDSSLADRWYREALKDGNDRALVNLGALYAHSDQVEAARWWELASERGVERGKHNLNSLRSGVAPVSEEEEEKILEPLLRDAGKGNVDAMLELGRLFMDDAKVKRSCPRAAVWLEKASDAGSVRPKLLLADIYSTGIIVPRKSERLMELLRGAARSGDPEILFLAAIRHPRFCRREEADEWLRISAEKGHAPAQAELAKRVAEEKQSAEAAPGPPPGSPPAKRRVRQAPGSTTN